MHVQIRSATAMAGSIELTVAHIPLSLTPPTGR
jgi:hypothetical protein